MSALALAMYLAGAGDVDDAQRRRRPVAPPPVIMVPAPPAPSPPPVHYGPAPPAPPPPPRFAPPQRARANLNSYFSADDYPAAALRGNEQGTTGFRLTIGPNGRVTACEVTSPSGSAALDRATCRILQSRARYTPARDSYGNPVAGSDSGRASWRLPPVESPVDELRAGIPAPFTPAAARVPFNSYVSARDYPAAALRARQEGATYLRLVIGIAGRVIACDIHDTSGSDALDAASCRIARARAAYTPARSQSGAFVCDVMFEEVEWLLPPRRRAGRGRAGAAMIPPGIEEQLAPGICPGRMP